MFEVRARTLAVAAVVVFLLALVNNLVILAEGAIEALKRRRVLHLAPVAQRVNLVLVVHRSWVKLRGRVGEIEFLAESKCGSAVLTVSQLVGSQQALFSWAVLHWNFLKNLCFTLRLVFKPLAVRDAEDLVGERPVWFWRVKSRWWA